MNRLDFEIIKNVVKDNSRVLDVGCESGELLKFLNNEAAVLPVAMYKEQCGNLFFR